MDKFRKKDADDIGTDEEFEPPIDVEARRPQLDQLENALRALARELASDTERMRNPGWSGRVADLRVVARDISELSNTQFTRTEVLDLVACVGPLPKAADYAPYAAAQAKVEAAAAVIREVLPSEQ